jgi:hypothetical protein
LACLKFGLAPRKNSPFRRQILADGRNCGALLIAAQHKNYSADVFAILRDPLQLGRRASWADAKSGNDNDQANDEHGARDLPGA